MAHKHFYVFQLYNLLFIESCLCYVILTLLFKSYVIINLPFS